MCAGVNVVEIQWLARDLHVATKLCRYYTKYCIQYHIVFSIIVVTFVMTLLVNECTNIVMEDVWMK